VQLVVHELQRADQLDAAFETAVRQHADVGYVATAPLFNIDRARVIGLAAQHQLPTMYQTTEYVPLGGLSGYEAADNELQGRAAYYVDRILKGAKPADLPVEQPMTFDFVVNMKTARALGITFPPDIMLQVTEVVD
jgi:putative ABC transport system substrate-binding protein